MLDDPLIRQLAAELHQSEKSRVQVEHFSKRYPGMTIEDGYAHQPRLGGLKRAEGRTVIGHKIGLTSRAMQHLQPDHRARLRHAAGRHAVLLHTRPGARHPRGALHRAARGGGAGLRAQGPAEGTRRHGGRRAGRHRVRDPAIEIIDARIEQFDRHTKVMRKVFDTISDNAANAGIVLGGNTVAPRSVDLPWCGAILRQNGVVEETGLAAGVQGHPAVGMAWLANKLAPWGECAAGRADRAGRLVHPARGGQGRRRVRRRLRRARPPAVPLRLIPRLPTRPHHANPRQPLQARARRQAPAPDRPVARPGRPYCAEICAGAGFDWLLIDGEHAPNGLTDTILAAAAGDCRLPGRPRHRAGASGPRRPR
jgi:2-oxo-hept-3-ene-1,7-dioate hydratase